MQESPQDLFKVHGQGRWNIAGTDVMPKGSLVYWYNPLMVMYFHESSSSKSWLYARDISRVVKCLPPARVANRSSGLGRGYIDPHLGRGLKWPYWDVCNHPAWVRPLPKQPNHCMLSSTRHFFSPSDPALSPLALLTHRAHAGLGLKNFGVCIRRDINWTWF